MPLRKPAIEVPAQSLSNDLMTMFEDYLHGAAIRVIPLRNAK